MNKLTNTMHYKKQLFLFLFLIVLSGNIYAQLPTKPNSPLEEEVLPEFVDNEVYEEEETEKYPKSKDGIYLRVEEMPRFPNQKCEEILKSKENSPANNKILRNDCAFNAFKSYIHKNLEKVEGGAGTIAITSFVVAKDGTLKDIGVQKKIGGKEQTGTEQIKRVIQKMNEDGLKWFPGIHKGKVVEVRYSLPIFLK